MKHDCPHCGESIKWKLIGGKPLPGERKFLPNRAVTICPVCSGELTTNVHWSEQAAGFVVAIPFFAFFSVRADISRIAVLWGAVATLLLWLAMFGFFHFRYWRYWQRYKAYEGTAK